MSLTREEALHIAHLAHVGIDEAELPKFQEQLSEILDHFAALTALDTEGVPPTSHPLALDSVMRDDEVKESLSVEDVLANAPNAEDDLFRVRAVLE